MKKVEDIQDSTNKLSDMDWNIYDMFDRRVLKSSNWCQIEDYRLLESRTGVFIFVNFLFQVKYIGKAEEGMLLTKINEAITSGKSQGALLIKVLYTKTLDKTESLEHDLVSKYSPSNNS
jgi:hypothetical protein